MTLGNSLTTTNISSVAFVEQELLAVTLYVLVDVGLTEILAVVSPVLHKKLPDPVAVKVIDSP